MLIKSLQCLHVLLRYVKKLLVFVLRVILPQMHIYPATILPQLLEMYEQQTQQ